MENYSTDSRGFTNSPNNVNLFLHNLNTEDIRALFVSGKLDSGTPQADFWTVEENPSELIHRTLDDAVAAFVANNENPPAEVAVFAWTIKGPFRKGPGGSLQSDLVELDRKHNGLIKNPPQAPSAASKEAFEELLGFLFSWQVLWSCKRAQSLTEVVAI